MIKKLLAAIAVVVGLGLAQATPALASPTSQITGNFAATCRGGVAGFLGLRSWDACLNLNANGQPEITGLNDIWLIALVVVEDMLKVGAYIAVGFIVWGGIKYVKSQGAPGETDQARQIIYNAVFGLLITMIAVAIVTFVAGTF